MVLASHDLLQLTAFYGLLDRGHTDDQDANESSQAIVNAYVKGLKE